MTTPRDHDQHQGGAVREGLRPAVSETAGTRRVRDMTVVAVTAAGLLAGAAVAGALSPGWATVLASGIAGTAWLRLRLSPGIPAAQDPAAAVRAAGPGRTQFPLTPETGVAIIERLPDPIILLDRSGRVVLHNRAAVNIVGAAAARRHISTVMRVPAVLEAVTQVISGEAAQVVEYTQPVPIERHYHAFIAPVAASGEDGPRDRRRSVLILLHDLTTLKRAEQMRADFVANASHELRTPLASLAGFVETLRGPAHDDPQARDRFLAIMQEQAERMGRLINDLLSLSRIELNEHVRPSATVDLSAIVNDTIDMLTPLADREGVEIVADIDADLPQPLGDRDELVQVCQNLIANAVKYGASGGRVEVRVAHHVPETGARGRGTSGVMIRVRDFGPGIAREHLPRLTERFYRVDVEQSRRRGGTGLGLAIVKHIVNRHMGSLSIDSEPGKGSTFAVFLPVDAPATDARLSGSPPADPVSPPADNAWAARDSA